MAISIEVLNVTSIRPEEGQSQFTVGVYPLTRTTHKHSY
jgi:hypothetical protein